jgi:hypothetical protein
MKIISTLIFTFTFVGLALSQEHTVRGFIYDKKNGEPVIFEKIFLLKADSSVVGGANTDVNGFFSIPKVNQGSFIIKIDNSNFKALYSNIEVKEVRGFTNVKFELEKSENVNELEDIVISAEGKKKKTEILISTIKLDKKAIERIPSVGAENDIVGAFSVTPGVVTTGDQGGQMYVRGGTPIQNKVLLDGMTIYNPFHSIGFFSIFETELIKNVDIYTGGFDAKYGGRISSVMDITYRDGNKKDFGGKVSVSPFLAKAVLEGPLKKKKDGSASAGSYIFSAKHSLLDYTSKSLYPSVNNGDGLPFNFTDLYGKVSFNGEDGSKFSAFGFHNQDSVNFYNTADLDFKASGGGINFLVVPNSSSTFIKGHVNGSTYNTTFNETAAAERSSSIGGFDLGFDFTHFLKNDGEMNYGFNLGGFNTKFHTFNELNRKIEIDNFTSEIGGYYNYRIIKNRWVIQPSIRVQVYASLSTISPEPRLGIKYNATEKLRFKFSGGRFSQNFTSASSDKDVVNLFNGLLSAPTNVQEKFVNQFNKEKTMKNGLQYAWHAIFGFEYDVTKKLSLNVEGYYKYFSQLSNINPNKLYDDNSDNSDVADVYKKDFIIESGQSYGVDLLLKYSKDRFFIWGVYSLGKSTRWDGFKEYFPVFDRRHNINIVSTYLFGKKKDLELSIRWNLGSGLPYTPTAGFYQNENFSQGVTTNYITNNTQSVTSKLGDFNSERLPYYHRLDITAKKLFHFKNKTDLEIIASVTNAYDRKNIFYVNRITGNKIYQFPILPSLGISYKF